MISILSRVYPERREVIGMAPAEDVHLARRLVSAAERAATSSWSSAQRAATAARLRAATAVERALDRVFDEPYRVPDANAARQILTVRDKASTSLVSNVLQGQAALRLTRAISRMSRLGAGATGAGAAASAGAGATATSTGAAAGLGPAAAATAAVASGARLRRVVQRGLMELRVMASFLVNRARNDGLTLDKALVRAAIVEIYLDPYRTLRSQHASRRAGSALALRWLKNAATKTDDGAQRAITEARISAIEGLDVQDVVRTWRSTASTRSESKQAGAARTVGRSAGSVSTPDTLGQS